MKIYLIIWKTVECLPCSLVPYLGYVKHNIKQPLSCHTLHVSLVHKEMSAELMYTSFLS
jgi:hypothetical protein